MPGAPASASTATSGSAGTGSQCRPCVPRRAALDRDEASAAGTARALAALVAHQLLTRLQASRTVQVGEDCYAAAQPDTELLLTCWPGSWTSKPGWTASGPQKACPPRAGVADSCSAAQGQSSPGARAPAK